MVNNSQNNSKTGQQRHSHSHHSQTTGTYLGMLLLLVVTCSILMLETIPNDGVRMAAIQSQSKQLSGRVLINVGPGTTATHALHNATCLLGLPGVHYEKGCLRRVTENDDDDKSSSSSTTTTTNCRLLEDSMRAHRQVIHYFYDEILQMKNTDVAVSEVLLTMERAMRRTMAFGTILAFHDSPYPHYMGLFERIHRELYGAPPIIILSHRDPQDWVMSRYRNHHPGLICLDNYDNIDHLGCMERAILAHRTSSSTSTTYNNNNGSSLQERPVLYLQDVFLKHTPIIEADDTLINNATSSLSSQTKTTTTTILLEAADGSQHKLSDILAGSVRGAERHYQRFSSRSVYTIDLFESARTTRTRMEEQEIAQQLRQVLPRSLLEKGSNESLLVDYILNAL